LLSAHISSGSAAKKGGARRMDKAVFLHRDRGNIWHGAATGPRVRAGEGKCFQSMIAAVSGI
jgi:hypothetical protein